MAFTDYYAALNISREATSEDIHAAFMRALGNEVSADVFRRATEAQTVLSDVKKRAMYDKNFGYLMVIQAIPFSYLSGMVYELTSPERAHAKFLTIVDEFKKYIEKRTQTSWDDAQVENYSYELFADDENPYVVLRFAHNNDVVSFADKLKRERVIKQ